MSFRIGNRLARGRARSVVVGRPSRVALLVAASGLAISFSASAARPPADNGGWQFSGDFRGGYFASERTARDGTESDEDAFNARLRLAFERSLNETWRFRTRVAGRFSSEQDDLDVYLHSYAPTRGGADFGDITLDEAYFGYQAPDDGLRLKVGRMQTAFAVPGVASKGLERNDSTGIAVNWTDGVHLDVPVARGWRGHLIAQYQDAKGSSSVTAAPLDFSHSGSRATVLLGLENKQPVGAVTQRMLSLTWMPDSLAELGLGDPSRQDYATVAARIAAEWPMGAAGAKLVTGAEVGYAVETPFGVVSGTGGTGDTGGLGWQLQASVYDFAPHRNIGVAIGRADAGWLISPDYRPNDSSVEVRYQWEFLPKTSMEARVRERRELEHPVGTRVRVDRDLYIRVSHKF